jgi:hypothetical protein
VLSVVVFGTGCWNCNRLRGSRMCVEEGLLRRVGACEERGV